MKVLLTGNLFKHSKVVFCLLQRNQKIKTEGLLNLGLNKMSIVNELNPRTILKKEGSPLEIR